MLIEFSNVEVATVPALFRGPKVRREPHLKTQKKKDKERKKRWSDGFRLEVIYIYFGKYKAHFMVFFLSTLKFEQREKAMRISTDRGQYRRTPIKNIIILTIIIIF